MKIFCNIYENSLTLFPSVIEIVIHKHLYDI